MDDTWSDESTDKAIRAIIKAMGLLIGFGWEQCFDASVDVLAEKARHSGHKMINPHSAKLLLTLFCAGLLVPAWYKYILPFIIGKGWEPAFALKQVRDLQKEQEDEDEEEAYEAGDVLRQ